MEGIARFIHETTRRMVVNNPDVEFHFLFDRKYDAQYIYGKNVTAHVLNPPARHPILWYLWFEHAVYSFLKNNKIDVFYSGDMFLSLRSKVPTLYVSHDLNYIHFPKGLKWSHLIFLQYFFPRYHARADHIVTVSKFSKKDIMHQFGIDADKITVAYNDVPEGFGPVSESNRHLIRNKFTEGHPFFIYVGSLHPRKNVSKLLMAFDVYKKSYSLATKLVIYGRKAFKTKDIFDVYNKMTYKEDVVFIDDKDCSVQEILPAANLMCYPSLFEGFGIPILEAFHAQVPVLTSNVSSMPEVAGEAAILVDPQNAEEIAEAMWRIESNPELQNLLKEKALQRTLEFSWDRSAKIIYDRLSELRSK
jgi:glycosyltransferase involved in cell wall biosynthesis